jgi:hypothetical protein
MGIRVPISKRQHAGIAVQDRRTIIPVNRFPRIYGKKTIVNAVWLSSIKTQVLLGPGLNIFDSLE